MTTYAAIGMLLSFSVRVAFIVSSIAVGDAILLPSRIRLKEPILKPRSDTRNFWTEWEEKQTDDEAIAQAVENMRCQTRHIEI